MLISQLLEQEDDVHNISVDEQIKYYAKHPETIDADKPDESTVIIPLIRKRPNLIQHITNPSEWIQYTACSSISSSIKYIQNPCLLAQLVVIRSNPWHIRHIHNPNKTVIQYALTEPNNIDMTYLSASEEDWLQLLRQLFTNERAIRKWLKYILAVKKYCQSYPDELDSMQEDWYEKLDTMITNLREQARPAYSTSKLRRKVL